MSKFFEINLQKIARDYVAEILDTRAPIKFLVIDSESSKILNSTISFTDLLHHHVYYTEPLEEMTIEKSQAFRNDEDLFDSTGIFFLRPSPGALEKFKQSLAYSKFRNIELIFSNILPKGTIMDLAKKDKCTNIKKVKTVFLDFHALEKHLFSFEVPSNTLTMVCSDFRALPPSAEIASLPSALSTLPLSHLPSALVREAQGLISLLLSIKRIPRFVFPKDSSMSSAFVKLLVRTLSETEEFKTLFSDFRKERKEHALVYIGARADDCLTPLLTTWTYHAMVGDLMDLQEGQLKTKQGKVSFITEGDFFDSVKDMAFGDLAVFLQKKIEEFKGRRGKVETLQEMASFIRDFPEFNKKQSEISKHVKICETLSNIVEKRKLIDVSELEQEALQNFTQANRAALVSSIQSPTIEDIDKLKLALLAMVLTKASKNTTGKNETPQPDESEGFYKNILLESVNKKNLERYKRAVEYYENNFLPYHVSTSLVEEKGWFKSASRLLAGVKDVFTQHRPFHVRMVEKLLKRWKGNELVFKSFEGVDIPADGAVGDGVKVVFLLGGMSFYEKTKFKDVRAESKNSDVLVLGGSKVFGYKEFTDFLCN